MRSQARRHAWPPRRAAMPTTGVAPAVGIAWASGVVLTAGVALAAGRVLAVPAGASEGDAPVVNVVVSIPPQAGIVEQVGAGCVAVQVLVQPGQEPHTYEPTPRQIMEIARAQVFFTIGMPFEERLVEKVRGSGVNLRFVEMAAGIERRALAEGEGEEGGNGHAGGHLDPHVWLAPALIERLAENSARALEELDPGHAGEYARALEGYRRDLRLADERIHRLLAPVTGKRFYVFHPDLGYFADAYGLEQVAVETEGKEPTPQQLAQLIASARADSVQVLFVQPQFSAQAVAAVASAIGGRVVPVDPLARDVLPNLERIARLVHDALAP